MRALLPNSVVEVPPELGLPSGGADGIVWIGVNSFEDRCLASLSRLSAAGISISRICFLDYPTSAQPEVEDRRIRRAHREQAASIASSCGAVLNNPSVDAYASAGLEMELLNFSNEAGTRRWIIDISCFTKIHVVTLANFLSSNSACRATAALVYTSPRAYGNLDQVSKQIGWNDVIIAPVAASAKMHNEGNSRGIVIAGHESERLWSALNEIEPSSGLLILGRIPSRPDITRLSEKINKGVIKHMALDYSAAWTRHVVDVSDIQNLEGLIAQEVEKASRADAPIILYPFGPKSLVLAASSYLLEHYPLGSWFVYPVPARYDLSYSEGASGSYWFSP